MQFDNDPLSWLLAPASKSVFLSEYFNQKHLLCRNTDRGRFGELLSFQDLDEILGTFGLKFPEIRLAQANQDVPRSEYTYRGDVIDPLRIARLFSEGATVIYKGLQDRHENVQLLCNALAEQATIQTQANIYLTPPHSQGFNIHWDTHDVFIIQIEGSKVWRIYEGGLTIPVKAQKFDSSKYEPGALLEEFTVQAGEVLYIPRGLMHAAASTDQISLHITLGFLGYTWSDLLVDALAEQTESRSMWRENLPFGYGNTADQGHARIKSMLLERMNAFITQVDVEPVINAHLWNIKAASRPQGSRYLQNALTADDLADTQVVERREGLSVSLECREDRVYLLGGARELSFPIVARKTLEAVLEDAPVKIIDLDDEIDLTSRKTVVSKLIQEGILKTNGA